MSKNIVLYSPGIDSFLLRIYLEKIEKLKNIKYIYFDIKSKYSEVEKIYLEKQKKYYNLNLKIVDNFFNFKEIEEPSAYIEFRNLYLLMGATKFGNNIFFTSTLSDDVIDVDPNNLRKFIKILNFFTDKKIKIFFPLSNKYKCELLKFFIENNYISINEVLEFTFSCYSPFDKEKQYIAFENLSNPRLFKSYECHSCRACLRKAIVLNWSNYFIKTNENYQIPDKYFVNAEKTKLFNDNKRYQAIKKYLIDLKEFCQRNDKNGNKN